MAIVGIVEGQERGHEALDHELLVATRDQDRHERVVAELEAGPAAHVTRRAGEGRDGERQVADQEEEEQHRQEGHDGEARVLQAERADQQQPEPEEEQQRPGRAGGSDMRGRLSRGDGFRREREGVGDDAHARLVRSRRVRQNKRPPSRTVTLTIPPTGPHLASVLDAGEDEHSGPGVCTRRPPSVQVKRSVWLGSATVNTLIRVPGANVLGCPRSIGPGEKPLSGPTATEASAPPLS